MSTTATLRIVPAPRFAGMREWDCARCGRQEVKPVFLSDGHAYGSGCAALLLGRPPTASRKIRDEAAAVQRHADELEAALEERRDRYARALVAFHADANAENPDLTSARRAYFAGGGSAVLGVFPAWIERVAATGELS